ncbi:MAG: hypothetical protein PHV55_07030 [Candidatus Omnitrophica bacterium]|nr:hypothetical protein [Candidatus Omnitrophota bacterium]
MKSALIDLCHAVECRILKLREIKVRRSAINKISLIFILFLNVTHRLILSESPFVYY